MKAAIIFLGAPGSGKGTQSRYLMEKYAIPVLGMGDLLRKEVKKNQEISKELSAFLDRGDIVPWSLARQIFEQNIDTFFQKKSVILDGVPRNIEQALDIDSILQKKGVHLLKAIHLDASFSVIQKRLSHRLVCTNCQASFSDENFTECPFCACSESEVRPDDNMESIKNRLEVHQKNMGALLNHYKKKNALLEVDANKSTRSVQKQVGEYIIKIL